MKINQQLREAAGKQRKNRRLALHMTRRLSGDVCASYVTGPEREVTSPVLLGLVLGRVLDFDRPVTLALTTQRSIEPVMFSLLEDSLSLRGALNELRLFRAYNAEARDILALLPIGLPMPACASPLTRRGIELTGTPGVSSLLLGR